MPRYSALLAAGLALWAWGAAATGLPPGYPSSYQEIIDAANQEGRLVIYAAADIDIVRPLINDFAAQHPAVKVEFNDINSAELYRRYTQEIAGGNDSADVVWSVAMDSQMKLANDGYAQAYNSPELSHLADWAHWRNEVFGTTFEPVVMAYNKKLLSPTDVPQTHAQFTSLLKMQPARFRGKVETYDIDKTASGFLFIAQDIKQYPGAWGLIRAMGQSRVNLRTSTSAMLDRISKGESLIGYNLLGSYTMTRAMKDPQIGVVMPTDYTLAISRLIFISKNARHPNAAKLWVDYLLSKRGQTLMAEKVHLYSVRDDINGADSSSHLYQQMGDAIKPVVVGPGLLIDLDKAKRREFMKQWQRSVPQS